MAKRRRRGQGKGPQFERDICKTLSEWYSKVGAEDLLWRTQASGARATTRAKQGKTTRGQYGDVCAVDGRARSLLKVFTISIKRGYRHMSMQDILDRSAKSKEPEFSEWIRDCLRDQALAKSVSWLLILKKDRRETLVFMPLDFPLFQTSFYKRKELLTATPSMTCVLRGDKKPKQLKKMKHNDYMNYIVKNNVVIFGMRFVDFLSIIDRNDIKAIAEKYWKELQ